MHQGKCRFFSLMMAIAVFLAGLYLDTAVEDVFFLYDFMGEAVLCQSPFRTDINNSKICSGEVLNEYGDVEQRSMELKPLLSSLCACRILPSQPQGKLHGDSWAVQPFTQTLDGLITNYMHRSDGKKGN